MCGVAPVDRTAEVVIVPMVIGSLALMAFVLRIIARTHVAKRSWGMDDWTITAAVLFMIPLMFLSIPCMLPTPSTSSSPPNNLLSIPLYYWDEIVYFPAIALTKISILLFYLDVFRRSIAGVQPVIYTLIALNVLYAIIFDLVSIFQCTPVPGAWLSWDHEHPSTCRNVNAQGWAAAAINILLDLATVILPLPELWQLSLSRTKKVQVMFMFSLGFIVTIVSILRLHSLVSFGNTTNLTQDYVVVGVWTTVEVPVGILCACLPAVRTILKVYYPAVFGSTRPSRSKYVQSTTPSALGSALGSTKPQLDVSVDRENWASKDGRQWNEPSALELHPVRARAESHVSNNEPIRPKEMA
ncbi:hypothetical protein JX265_003564 [Neoarthrinium moseri]|uniref:Rhodopsin domain-containing protein n=1 Tax=Neoarthrinium moseri TaxID=1658444 RepID=A0A9P9WS62_9PEZI|nr:uncharacterized protein JN550_002307 [Neoarthrinium moseri]KAI1874878.1 hypothetical protein JN550_002307 [Neoarthrinium moseri]KAI1877556.1 hypothetical protein JX265_003564 [Neoarthrinium moseri]